MLSILLVDSLRDDAANASSIIKAAYARRDLPIKRLAVVDELSDLSGYATDQLGRFNVFIASFSKKIEDYIAFARTLKQQKENTFIVFIVDKRVDISACVRPSVRPSGILFIPLEKLRIYQTIKEIYVEHLRLSESEEQPVFTIKSGGEYFSINTGEISFFEAQGKKIAVKTKGQEISFYSNFDTILEQLPDWFVRCHKGYVVNSKQIVQANFTDMTLKLKDHAVIPISRTYRDSIRAIIEPKEV